MQEGSSNQMSRSSDFEQRRFDQGCGPAEWGEAPTAGVDGKGTGAKGGIGDKCRRGWLVSSYQMSRSSDLEQRRFHQGLGAIRACLSTDCPTNNQL